MAPLQRNPIQSKVSIHATCSNLIFCKTYFNVGGRTRHSICICTRFDFATRFFVLRNKLHVFAHRFTVALKDASLSRPVLTLTCRFHVQEYVLQELVSPVITPFLLCFNLRYKALDIVDFFRNFTVDVVGVGDVCSFAQMDVKRHGNPEVC